MRLPFSIPAINPWLIAAVVVSHVALGVWAFNFGASHEAGKHAQELHDQSVAYAGEIVRRQDSIDNLAGHIEKLRSVAAAKDRIITKEVIRYESIVPADRRCLLLGAWRVLHDSAATGEPAATESSGLPARGAEPVADSAALSTVADNYADCRRYIEQVKGWQAYYRAIEGGGEIRAQAAPSK